MTPKFKPGVRVESRFWVGSDPELPVDDRRVYFSGIVVEHLDDLGCVVLVDRGTSPFSGRTSCCYSDLVLSPDQEAT